jgi:deoxyribonuclease V
MRSRMDTVLLVAPWWAPTEARPGCTSGQGDPPVAGDTDVGVEWPRTVDELIEVQVALARAEPPPWRGPAGTIGGCAIRAAKAGDAAWAAAVAGDAEAVVAGTASAPYEPGLLALREGPLLEAAVRGARPDVLLVDATGRDHPRRAGLALHLGAVLDLPTVGVTHRPLHATGEWPDDARGAWEPLELEGETVGAWLRTRRGVRPLAVHAAWRTDTETAVATVLQAVGRHRTPEPLRAARRLARLARG